MKINGDIQIQDTGTSLNDLLTKINNLTPSIYLFSGSYTSVNNQQQNISISVPKTGVYLVSLTYLANQGGYKDNILSCGIGNNYIQTDIRNTWNVSSTITNSLSLNSGTQVVAWINMFGSYTVNWKITLTYIGQ